MSVYAKLHNIQTKLKAPKAQFNEFGRYKYRNCEDILEAVKPILHQERVTLVMTDEVTIIGTRYYIKAVAILTDIESGESITNSAYAREEETKKGMDGSQITGASSSYARKYALNGLLAIDDAKDSDSTNKTENQYITLEQIEELKSFGFDEDRLKNMAKYYRVVDICDVKYKQAEEVLEKQRKVARNNV